MENPTIYLTTLTFASTDPSWNLDKAIAASQDVTDCARDKGWLMTDGRVERAPEGHSIERFQFASEGPYRNLTAQHGAQSSAGLPS